MRGGVEVHKYGLLTFWKATSMELSKYAVLRTPSVPMPPPFLCRQEGTPTGYTS